MATTPTAGIPVSTLPIATAVGPNDRVVVLRPDESLDKDKLATVSVALLADGAAGSQAAQSITYDELRQQYETTGALLQKWYRITDRTSNQPDAVVYLTDPDTGSGFGANNVQSGAATSAWAWYDLVTDAFVLPLAAGGAPFTITPTETLGGIVAGTTYNLSAEDYFRTLLVRYQAPGFSSFSFNGQGSRTVPVGTVIPATTTQAPATFAWATVNNQNMAPASISLRDITGNSTLATGEANDGTLTAATAGFTVGLGESRRYRLAATNTQGAAFAIDLVIVGETEAYLGTSTATSLTGAQLVALGGAQLQGSRARTAAGVTTSGGAYLYYAYDSRHGDLTSIILDGAAPVLGAFQKLGDVASTNATGAAVTLRVYRSNAVNAFSNNSLAFS
jgi:hypothetical protein